MRNKNASAPDQLPKTTPDKTICPVCGQHHFEEVNGFEECPVCGWVDDGVQRDMPDYRGGYNIISLNEAKAKFAAGKKVFDD